MRFPNVLAAALACKGRFSSGVSSDSEVGLQKGEIKAK